MKLTHLAILVLAASLAGCCRAKHVAEPVDTTGRVEVQKLTTAYLQSNISRGTERIQTPLPVLEELRMGNTDAAIEILEHTLDQAIIHADAAVSAFTNGETRSVEQAMQAARAYRKKYPRPEVWRWPESDVHYEYREGRRQKAQATLERASAEDTANETPEATR